jgi:arylformamidase
MNVFPGDPSVQVTTEARKSSCFPIVSIFSFGSHTGTHIDSPSHLFKDGVSILDFPLELTSGNALVNNCDDPLHKIMASTRGQDIQFLIFNKTDSKSKFPRIRPSDADALKQLGIKILGTDFLSVDQVSDKSFLNHKNLLSTGIWIVENLDLSKIDSGAYRYIMLPMKTSADDGSPVRAILIDDNR